MKRKLKSLIEGLTGAAFLGLVLGFFQRLHPVFDSFSHFRIHFAIIAGIGCLLLTMYMVRRWPLVVVAIALFGLAQSLRFESLAVNANGAFSVAQYNLNYDNERHEDYIAGIRAIDADVVLLQEDNPGHRAAIREGLSELYPHQDWCNAHDSARKGGVGILSRVPLRDGACTSNSLLMWRKITLAGTDGAPVEMSVASIHLYWPWPYDQHAQIDELGPLIADIAGPLVIGGDFNATPWSDSVRRLREAGGLDRLPGAPMTIHAGNLVPAPIDHQLHSSELCPVARWVGASSFGSDHFPVVVEYQFGRCE